MDIDTKITLLNDALKKKKLTASCYYEKNPSFRKEDMMRFQGQLISVPSNKIIGIGRCQVQHDQTPLSLLHFTTYLEDGKKYSFLELVEKEKEYKTYSKEEKTEVKVGKAVIFKFALLMRKLGIEYIRLTVLETGRTAALFRYYQSLGFRCMKPKSTGLGLFDWELRDASDEWYNLSPSHKDYFSTDEWYRNCIYMQANVTDILLNCCNV